MKTVLFILAISFIFPNDTPVLGRDKDPGVVSDINRFKLWGRKTSWNLLTSPGLRVMTRLIYPKSTISHFHIGDNVVAFTIDDGFCGLDNLEGCMIEEVRELFKSYDAKATFFITGSHYNEDLQFDIELLLADGHELAHHNMMDWSYADYSEQDFKIDFDQASNILNIYTSNTLKWYRAPFGRLSKTMQKVLDDNSMIHVVSDAFANDTAIPDPEWISKFILRKVKPGSIVLIHMPEKGVREWNFEAIRLTLEGLSKKGIKIVTVSELNSMKNN